MSQTVQAVYRDGHFELLEPVTLVEGQKVNLTIESERDRIRAILGDLLVPADPNAKFYTEAELEELERQVEVGFRGVTLSDVIVEERRKGP